MICAACQLREARSLGWFDPAISIIKKTKHIPVVNVFHACSTACMNALFESQGKMQNPTQNEINSMLAAADRGGEYLDALGKTDLATLDRDEWMSFIDATITGYVDAIRSSTGFSIREDAQIPF